LFDIGKFSNQIQVALRYPASMSASTIVMGTLQGVLPEMPRWGGNLLAGIYDPGTLGTALQESGASTVIYAPPADILLAARTTYGLGVAATDSGMARIVLISSMGLLAGYPENWRVDARWRPRPDRHNNHLLPLYLAELSLREIARATGLRVSVVRIPAPPGPEADAAVLAALNDTERWKIHLVPVPRPLGFERHDAVPVLPTRPIRKVAVLGASGPLGAVLIDELKDDYALRLADIRPLNEAKPQSDGAPVPVFPGAPHEEVYCDVRDRNSVIEVCEGCDAIINLTVIRSNFADAFAVNTLGAWNVGQAAMQHQIRRVVQTGPQLITLHGENDYQWDWDISSDPPPRPGRHLYGHSKFLGQEILRVFADACGLEVPVLLFNNFANPGDIIEGAHPMMLSWQDSARAIRAALEVETLPSPYEVFHCCVNFPHGQMNSHKAKWLLGWEAQDPLAGAYVSRDIEPI
jgi:nucleoside-diphosphate-sugar epimerase